MTNSKELLKVLLLLVIACTTFSACGDDDDDDFSKEGLKTYVVGKWHSYKGVVTANGVVRLTSPRMGIFPKLILRLTFRTMEMLSFPLGPKIQMA